MSYGLATFNGSGGLISQFDGDFMRFVARIRVEALASGSYQIPSTPSKSQFFFQADDPLLKTPPLITISPTGLLQWRPYQTSPTFHTGGYILVAVRS